LEIATAALACGGRFEALNEATPQVVIERSSVDQPHRGNVLALVAPHLDGSYDPWGHYEKNADHYVAAQAVKAACWMAAGLLDFPEQFDAGLKPHSVD
jgi:hypothetical protein